MDDVIHSQRFMLKAAHRKLLQEQYGVHTWHFEQYEWEGVFIPGGCPHQVRNLRSCIKVSVTRHCQREEGTMQLCILMVRAECRGGHFQTPNSTSTTMTASFTGSAGFRGPRNCKRVHCAAAGATGQCQKRD